MASSDPQPGFLAGGVRLPDPRLVEPLSIFRDRDGRVWQALPSTEGLVWQPVILVSDRVHEVSLERVERLGQAIWVSVVVTLFALFAALYLPLHAGLFGGGALGAMLLPFVRLFIVAVPLAVTLALLRQRRRAAQWAGQQVTPSTIELPTGAVDPRR